MSRSKLLPGLWPALLALSLAFMLPLIPGNAAEPPAADSYRLSGPLTHDNLAVYFVHGESRPGPVPLTLREALANKTVEVRETGNVNELRIMNAGDEAVYIQSGDIVKGGRQDRVLLVSMLLPPGSGEMPIPVFCVEAQRWSGRAGESATKFESAEALLPSRAAKLAMRGSVLGGDGQGGDPVEARGRIPRGADSRALAPASSVQARQQEVWNGVATIQRELSSSLGAPVASPRSLSSLQLTLENEGLSAKQAEFVESLQKSGEEDSDILGYVVAINGRLNSAEIYPSNGLFRKMWPALLRASATEAIKDRNGESRPLPTTADATAFLGDAQAAHGVDQAASPSVQVNVRQSPAAAMFESRPAAMAPVQWINRSYLAR
jgi:hypothetical protein